MTKKRKAVAALAARDATTTSDEGRQSKTSPFRDGTVHSWSSGSFKAD